VGCLVKKSAFFPRSLKCPALAHIRKREWILTAHHKVFRHHPGDFVIKQLSDSAVQRGNFDIFSITILGSVPFVVRAHYVHRAGDTLDRKRRDPLSNFRISRIGGMTKPIIPANIGVEEERNTNFRIVIYFYLTQHAPRPHFPA